MNKFFIKLKQLLLYGGLEKEQYRMISSEIDEANRKSIIILSTACLIVYALRLCLSYSAVPDMNRIVFLNAILLFGILAIGNILVKQNSHFVHISACLFMVFYLGVGILSAIGPGSIHERTTLYLVFVVVAPMLYALNAVELTAIIAPAEIIYLLLIAKFQSSYSVYITNQGNSLFFSISGLLLGIYMANMKISGIYNTYMNARTEEIKQLNKELAFSQHLLSLINDVLDMSRIESGKVTIEESPMCISELLHDIRTITQPEIDARHLDFYIDTKQIVNETFMGDHLRLQQVLLNILSNSIKFTAPGGKISLCISQLQTAPAGYADYEFRIKDNGIGMSEEFKEHIFEAFTRENTSTVSGIQGTGLGMSITKNIIDLMNGTIVVNSKEGKGSEFIISLRFSLHLDPLPKEEEKTVNTQTTS